MGIDFQTVREQARAAGLSGAALLDEYTNEQLAEICNGIGAAWMDCLAFGGASLSDYLNAKYPEFIPAACIHDLRYHRGGDSEARKAADTEFLSNCLARANEAYAWYHSRRYLLWLAAWSMYRLVRAWGPLAFNLEEE